MSSSRTPGAGGPGDAGFADTPSDFDDTPAPPPVTVVMPVLNEARHLRRSVGHALGQDYPGAIEVVLAVGPSTDGTHELVARLKGEDPRVRSVRNPSGATPNALNAAVRAARHEIVVRVDGHAMIPPDYVRTAVELLCRTGADNVGGIMAAEGETPFERAVACAMTSPLGVGGSRFHTGGEEGPSDTVYLGVFRRSTLERLGGYDEAFARAQDWELNYRIRRAGGLVYFSPALRVSYRPRSSVRSLARQYRDYGRWRRVVMRQHHGSATLRYLTPPVALVGVVAGLAVGLVGLVAGSALLTAALVVPGGYAAAVSLGGLVTGWGLPVGSLVRLPLVYAVMHLAWGWGFLTSNRSLGAGARSAEHPGEPSVSLGG
ncbi:MAG: glycosyltransferase family 2 protein [Actinomycetes bacterium]